MNNEQIAEMTIKNSTDISAIQEKLSSAHKRIDDNDRITEGIHKLAANVESMTVQLKNLAERMEQSLQSIETRLRAQGERIGAIENKPGKKWEAVVEKVLLVIIGGIAAFIMAKIGI